MHAFKSLRSLLAGTFLLLFTATVGMAAASSGTGPDDEIEGQSGPSSQIPVPQEGDKPEAEENEPPEGNGHASRYA